MEGGHEGDAAAVEHVRSKIYAGDYLQPDRLLSLLGRHREVFLFSRHTHWDLALSA
ncbi:hypothetical protein [Kitasatospora purpeofusca]|uniref:hypothetical protein n=1 Tax=Kitasatospora purpeofusca TaxID=67352 RepID=UPI0036617DEF